MSLYTVTNPATGELQREFPTATDAQIQEALGAAEFAHQQWSRSTTVNERSALVRRVGELHTARRDELAAIISQEMGKSIDQALGEVDFSAAIYGYYADKAPRFLADEPIDLIDGSGTAFIRRSPLGVLLGIMPWNYPYYQVARFAAPNLALGNPVVLKHAPQCPQSAAAIEEIFSDAGFPAGAYVNIYATNEQIAAAIADPRVQGVSVTGSERAGAAVAEVAGRHLKKVVCELGGSDPFILLSTNDLDATVDAAINARMENTGQACNAAKRFIIIEHLYDDFLAEFSRRVLAIDRLSPLSSAAAAERLERQVAQAVDHGATLLTHGRREGAHYPPAVLTDVTSESPAYRDELFGPVATIFKVADEDEAISVANDTPYGLGSYVFTTEHDQALRVADRLHVGMVFINAVGAEGAELPFGGVKRSGFGRELGSLGIDEFANKKLIRIN